MSSRSSTTKHSPRGIRVANVRRLLLGLPDVVAGRSYGMPSFLLKGRFFARFRDDDTVLVLQLGAMAEREVLMRLEPRAFFFTEHYRNYPAVLIRLADVPQSLLVEVVQEAWHQVSAFRADRLYPKGAMGSQRPTARAKKRPPPNQRLKLPGRGGRSKGKGPS